MTEEANSAVIGIDELRSLDYKRFQLAKIQLTNDGADFSFTLVKDDGSYYITVVATSFLALSVMKFPDALCDCNFVEEASFDSDGFDLDHKWLQSPVYAHRPKSSANNLFRVSISGEYGFVAVSSGLNAKRTVVTDTTCK